MPYSTLSKGEEDLVSREQHPILIKPVQGTQEHKGSNNWVWILIHTVTINHATRLEKCLLRV